MRSKRLVEYTAPEKLPYYADCEPLVSGLGLSLVELSVFKRQSSWQVKLVITGPQGVGIAECTKIHRALLTRLEAVLATQDMYVEVTSPGLDRIFKNASEFAVFTGKQVKIWNTDVSDWMQGTIVSADAVSVSLETSDGQVTVPYQKINKAKLSSAA
jgi:ribosome maturation factor RimP